MNRLLIYFIYDSNGIIDDYIFYFLNAFKKQRSEVCVVINGKVKNKAEKALTNLVDKVIVRKNIGYDSAAYKEALESYGFENLKKYDEVILANFTMYGPIFPIEEMFYKMDKKDIDFWGITKHPALKAKIANVYVNEHIQSYFIAYRKKMVSSDDFKNYWNTIKTPTTYEEAIAFHELRNTEYFEKLGYKSDTYIDFKKYKNKLEEKAYFYYIIQQLKEDRMPFIKRKIFQIKKSKLEIPIKGGADILIKYIDEKTPYDIALILQNIDRTMFHNVSFIMLIFEYLFLTFKKYLLPWHWKHYNKKRQSSVKTLNILKKLKIANKKAP